MRQLEERLIAIEGLPPDLLMQPTSCPLRRAVAMSLTAAGRKIHR